jgi:hypothetical protein
MADEIKIERPTRVCFRSGRPLVVGEKIRTALVETDAGFQRQDYAWDAWSGRPDNCLADWTTTLPDARAKPRVSVSDETMLDCFERLATSSEPGQRNLRYVLGLWLMRRKKLTFQEVQLDARGESMIFRSRDGRTHAVLDPGLNERQMHEADAELRKLLEG